MDYHKMGINSLTPKAEINLEIRNKQEEIINKMI